MEESIFLSVSEVQSHKFNMQTLSLLHTLLIYDARVGSVDI